jgi:succinate dehydrogenase / fumarate reductase cytochrome b subunit
VPIGAFIIEHMVSNAAVINRDPQQAYGDQVKFLNSLPLVLGLEIAFIYAPILFHGIYGLFITKQSEPNVSRYRWLGNWTYLWQRITGVVLLVFIVWHTLTARFLGMNIPDHPYTAFAKMAQELSNGWIFAWFIIGITFVCYHFAYGLFLFAAKWGITLGETARHRWGWICAVIGVVFEYVWLASAFAFRGISIYPVR